MTADIKYEVSFGDGDGSEWLDADVELTEEESKIYDHALKFVIPFEEVSGLEDALDRARQLIEAQEIENALDMEYEYAIECTGRTPMDTFELNELVHERNSHALEFFGLDNLSDDEIEAWDADDLDDIPDVCDFVENFEVKNPFDSGWSLTVEFYDPTENSDELSEDDAIEALTELFQTAEDDEYTELWAYVDRVSDYRDCETDIYELVSQVAAELGIEGLDDDED